MMNNNLVSKVGEIGQDNLFAGLFPRAFTFGIVIAALESGEDDVELKRGTVLCEGADGKMSAFAGSAGEAKFNGDGTTKTFTIAAKPAAVDSVTVGGTAAQIDSYVPYTGVVTLHTAPAAGTGNVVASFSNGSVPCCILCDDVVVTDAGDVTAVAYRSGNFNPDAVILAGDAELSIADKDALRKYDIIFTQMLEA